MKYVILHDIRSHYNVGAIFRTCDGAGVAAVYLSGLTPLPIDRFGRKVPEIHKTALGAEESMPWQAVADVTALITSLKAQGIEVVVVEQAPEAVLLPEYTAAENTAYLLGSETGGVPPEILAQADRILELPMKGSKESLNVSVVAGIVLYHN